MAGSVDRRDCAIRQRNRLRTSCSTLAVSWRSIRYHAGNMTACGQRWVPAPKRGLLGLSPMVLTVQSECLPSLNFVRTLPLRALLLLDSRKSCRAADGVQDQTDDPWRLAMISSYALSDSLSTGLPISPQTGHVSCSSRCTQVVLKGRSKLKGPERSVTTLPPQVR